MHIFCNSISNFPTFKRHFCHTNARFLQFNCKFFLQSKCIFYKANDSFCTSNAFFSGNQKHILTHKCTFSAINCKFFLPSNCKLFSAIRTCTSCKRSFTKKEEYKKGDRQNKNAKSREIQLQQCQELKR